MNRNNIKKILLIVLIVVETIILFISLTYSMLLFGFNDVETKWFDDISPDGQFEIRCYKVGTPLFFSEQKLRIYFHESKLTDVKDINNVCFETDLGNKGKTVQDENYEIEWMQDSIKIVFRGEETGGDNIYIIPYYKY